MALTDVEKDNIKQYLNLDIVSLTNSMTKYLDQRTKADMDEAAILYVAQKHNRDFESMKEIIDNPGSHSVYGGEHAAELYKQLRNKVENLIQEEKEILKEAVCTGLKYCEKRKSGVFENDDYSFAILIADSILTYTTSIPFPVASIAVYLIKKGVLDKWCGCN